jgi:hypothetical protein
MDHRSLEAGMGMFLKIVGGLAAAVGALNLGMVVRTALAEGEIGFSSFGVVASLSMLLPGLACVGIGEIIDRLPPRHGPTDT